MSDATNGLGPNYKPPPFIKFSGTITLGHILQLAGMLIAGIFFAVKLESRIDVSDVRLSFIDEREKGDMDQVKGSLAKVDGKLDLIQQTVDQKADRPPDFPHGQPTR